jgi:hypothetical protein
LSVYKPKRIYDEYRERFDTIATGLFDRDNDVECRMKSKSDKNGFRRPWIFSVGI